ncbi:MAG: hypothetical protein JO283_09990 [Bradyrhizobium sp.]|nr:hypothetical protein [Bradyrhizobium sp.]
MHEALEPARESGWVLSHKGYDLLSESALEFRFAFGNGFLGMRAARSVSRGPTWVGWLGYTEWASWPRCYVACLFDMPTPVPALVPVADWSRVRIVLDGEPLLAREGEVQLADRKLDMRRGLLLSAWTHRTPAGITVTGRELRLLWRSLSVRVRWRGRPLAIRIAGSTVQVTQTNGEAMEMRIAGAKRQLKAGAPLQVSL